MEIYLALSFIGGAINYLYVKGVSKALYAKQTLSSYHSSEAPLLMRMKY